MRLRDRRAAATISALAARAGRGLAWTMRRVAPSLPPSRRPPRRRRAATLAALLAALCLVLQPMLHGAAMAALQPGGDFILVCSADGARLIPAPDGAPPADRQGHAHENGCTDCMPPAGAALLSLAAPLVLPASWAETSMARPAPAPVSRHRLAAGARAPPPAA